MAGHISQEAFDAAVVENMETFELSAEEAVAETVSQFEAQGVNLDSIVKEYRAPSSADSAAPKHRVVEAVESLQRCLAFPFPPDSASNCIPTDQVLPPAEDPASEASASNGITAGFDIGACVEACAVLRSCCEAELAQRCLAAQHGAYPVLISALQRSTLEEGDWSLCSAALECLATLLNGQPDLLDESGTDLLLQLLQGAVQGEGAGAPAGAAGDSQDALDAPPCSGITSSLLLPPAAPVPPSLAAPSSPLPPSLAAPPRPLPALLLRVVRRCCVMHEQNRQRFVARGLVPLVAAVLARWRADRAAVMQCCAVYSALTLDDDMRAQFGKAHEHARTIVVESDAIKTILRLTADYATDVEVLGELLSTLGRLAVRDEFCQQVLEHHALNDLLAALQRNINNQGFVRACLGVLKALCGSDPVKAELVRGGGASLVIDALDAHARSAVVCEAGCAALAAVVLRYPAHAAEVMRAHAAESIVRAMELHMRSTGVQKQACMAIRNIVSRCPENCPPFLELGAERLLRDVMGTHQGACCDEAKAALRDLGCSVELRELWAGTGRDLVHD